MYITKGMEGGQPKCLQMRTEGEEYHASCVRTHLHYLFSCFSLMVSYRNKLPFQYVYFFSRVLCIYIILYKGCHVLYVFGLNSTVGSHIVDVHLSSDQVTYYFMMDADLYFTTFVYQKFLATFSVY